MFRTTFSGGAWSGLTALAGLPRTQPGWISDMHAEPGATGRVWATTSTVPGGGRVFRSEDGGATWTDRTAGLPNLPVNGVEVDAGNRNRVWIGLDLGVYQSRDSGATCRADFSASLPNAYVGDLVFHPHARVLQSRNPKPGGLGDPRRRLDDATGVRGPVERLACG